MSIPAGDVAAAARATGLGLAMRYRAMSSTSARVGAWTGVVVGFSALMAAARMGDTIRVLAQVSPETVMGKMALGYLRQWADVGFGTAAAVVIAFCLVLAFGSPLTAAVHPGLIPLEDRAGFPFARMSRFTDSLVGALTNLTSVIVLLALTGLSSLLTVDGVGRSRAVLVGWGVFAAVLSVSVCVSWVLELVRRTRPGAVRWVAPVAVVAVAVGVAFDPRHGTTLFGAGTWIAHAWVHAPGWQVGCALVALVAGPAALGWWACSAALRRPERAATRTTFSPRRGVLDDDGTLGPRASRELTPARVLWSLTWRTVWRREQVRMSLVAVAVVVVGAGAACGFAVQAQAGVLTAAPLVLTLAWPAGSLVMLDGAGPWLSSLPRADRLVLVVHAAAAAAQQCASVALYALAACVTHPWQAGQVGRVLVVGVTIAAVHTVVAVWLATSRPRAVALEAGAAVLTPARTMSWSLALLVGIGVPSAWAVAGKALGFPVPGAWALSGWCAAVVALAASAGALVWRRWSDRVVRAGAIARAHR